MATILRSSVRIWKTARHALSIEGVLSVRPLHAGRSTNCIPTADASHVKQFPKPAEVDSLVKKIEDTARKEVLIRHIERLAQEQKSTISSPHLLGVALPCFVAASYVGSFLAGYRVGFMRATEGIPSSDQQKTRMTGGLK